jgi:ADP-heptose:LPS heptosyltransferase
VRLLEASPQHLLVIRLDNIGDVVMLSPALRALRRHFPQARITLMASPAGSQVAPLLPWVDDVFTHSAMWQELGGTALDPSRERALIQRLAHLGADAALIFTSFIQSPHPPAFACYLAGIPIRVGQSKEFGGMVLSEWVRAMPDDAHQVDHNCHLLEAIGIHVDDRSLDLTIPRHVDEQALSLLAAHGIDEEDAFIVAAPGASCASRRYPPVKFASVCRRLGDATGVPIVVLASERERSRIAPFFDNLPAGAAIDLSGRTTVPEMAAIIARSRLLLGNNSGPMHIGDAFRRPAVILFSGTDMESQWRPRNSPAQLLRIATSCSPCRRFTCPYNMECLDLEPESVLAGALAALGSPSERRFPATA